MAFRIPKQIPTKTPKIILETSINRQRKTSNQTVVRDKN